ncbi:MAG: prenyltransferase/squalene oxidase repeat-containing protein, partial [Planctomycetota bacterium]
MSTPPGAVAPNAATLTNATAGAATAAAGVGLGGDGLFSAWLTARAELLSHRTPAGCWVGELSSSALSTATAISALSIAECHSAPAEGEDDQAAQHWKQAYQTDLSDLLYGSARWLAGQQNDDGGWGDTDRSGSNIATTLLALSAFRLTGVPARFADLEPRAEEYVRRQGGAVAGLRERYGRDKTFAAPILANCAIAGIVPWKRVPALPFELAAAPQAWFRLLQMPVVSYAIPALVAIGLARHHHAPGYNPLTRTLRRLTAEKCLRVVTGMQPDSGGFLEATPLTAFVVMALASAGRADHPVVRRGVEFLLASVRPDGSWPIDTNLATWNTTLAVNALRRGERCLPAEAADAGDSQPGESDTRHGHATTPNGDATLDWLLACQHIERHPFTGADPGGWAWTDLSGGVPDADDTPGALLALQGYWGDATEGQRARIARAARRGIHWLLGLQNRDGGWPTFCRGWGKLPFDRSATDLTAHALRAMHAWRNTDGWATLAGETEGSPRGSDKPGDAAGSTADLATRIDAATAAGLRFLANRQAADGSWAPLWFGNEHRPGEANPVYGTARVLQALAQLDSPETRPMALRGLQWLVDQQHASGGWGAAPAVARRRDAHRPPHPGAAATPASTGGPAHTDSPAPIDSVEETAVATDALLAWEGRIATPQEPDEAGSGTGQLARAIQRAAAAGTAWLIDSVNRDRMSQPAPIGLYFAKLWYYEKLYPHSFAGAALGNPLETKAASPPGGPPPPATP